MNEIKGWGRFPSVRAHELLSEDLERASEEAVLSRGLGRSYGDASLPPREGQPVAGSRLADRLIAFDPETGVLRAEAGLSLRELNRLFPVRGWATPVSPGTQDVTLGGMVASDVHGGNHHVSGCFGEYVRALRMRVADGRVLEITEANPSPWLWGESQQVHDLDELVATLRESSREWPFTKSWVDCMKRGPRMGRGIVMRGRWARAEEAPSRPPAPRHWPPVPIDLPSWTLNALTMTAFNTAFFHKHGRKTKRGILHPGSFTYPLDAIPSWNRIYGRRGLAQYQCVLPVDEDPSVVRRFFDVMTSSRVASFLTVVKDCGPEGKGLLSFPKRGISVALDLPIRGARTQAVVDALNEVVIAAGGRIYLTKDSLTRPEHFRAMEPRLAAWNAVRRKWDPEGRIRSAQSVRLLGDEA